MTSPLTPAGLRCAHQIDPLGVAPDRVSLSWLLAGTGHGRAQTSYQVVITQERAGEAGGGQPPGTAAGCGPATRPISATRATR